MRSHVLRRFVASITAGAMLGSPLRGPLALAQEHAEQRARVAAVAGNDREPLEHAADEAAPREEVTPGRAEGAPGGGGEVPSQDVSPVGLPVRMAATSAAISTEISKSAVSVPQGAGKIGGMGESFSAQLSTGTAEYDVPIAIPTARGRADVSLSLHYQSSGGGGVAGLGWSLGFPAISRQTSRGVPKYDDRASWHPNQDRFIYGGGGELVPICTVAAAACTGVLPGEVMPSWSNGWQYFRARDADNGFRFFWSPDHTMWRVQDQNGVVLELGGTTDSVEADPASPSRIFAWNLSREFDAEGGIAAPVNTSLFSYATVAGINYLTDIYMTPPRGVPSPTRQQYAHHVRLSYGGRTDPATSYHRGWLTRLSQRLTGIDVASKKFGAGVAAPREQLRRYRLGYDPGSHPSLLTSVQVEGRCASAITEDSTESLPASTGCPVLPPMSLGYSHVSTTHPAVGSVAGYEPIDSTIQSLPTSPSSTIGVGNADLFDVNKDSLPDVLLASTSIFPTQHAVFFNGTSAGAAYGPPQPMSVAGPGDANAFTLVPNQNGVVGLDLDGNAAVNLVHIATTGSYSVYESSYSGAWTWSGRAVTAVGGTSMGLSLLQNQPNVRVADVNGDGMVDFVQTLPNAIQTYFSLARFPGGADQFGQGAWASSTSAGLSALPAQACLPVSGSAVSFADANTHLNDMNGDGLVDIVRLRPTGIEYWPGRGNGSWGTGPFGGCAPGGSVGSVAMSAAPVPSTTPGTVLRIEDVNQDGYDDLVQVATGGVTLYLNQDGVGWSGGLWIGQQTPNPERVRIADINGSGAGDIVWGNGSNYQFIDPLAGGRPYLLTHVENGLGRTLDLQYQSSAQHMLAALQASQPWASVMPINVPLVVQSVESDHLAIGSSPVQPHVVQYTYRDPDYDGQQRDFHGFRSATRREVGDGNSPTSVVATQFLTGECAVESGATLVPCTFADRWKDNPRDLLKGVPRQTDEWDENGHAHLSQHHAFRLRTLYTGLDGRLVRDFYARTTDTFAYDPSAARSTGSTVTLPEIERTDATGTVVAEPGVSVSLLGAAVHLRQSHDEDLLGHVTDSLNEGCVSGCSAVDNALGSHVQFSLVPDGSGWQYKATESYTFGTDGAKHSHLYQSYDAFGHPTDTFVELIGTLPLDRFHATGSAVAPSPPTASADGAKLQVLHRTFDELGHAVLEHATTGDCHGTTYDPEYGELPTIDRTFYGSPDSTGCGSLSIGTLAQYDRGLGAATMVTAPGGAMSIYGFDGFGRLAQVNKPSVSVLGTATPIPSVTFEYLVTPNATTQPYSIIHSRTHDGQSDADPSYADSYWFVNGFGSIVARIHAADPADGFGWVVSGVTELDAKGSPAKAYQPYFTSVAPDSFVLTGAGAGALFSRQSYDAFGNPFEAFALDGSVRERVTTHAVSVDLYDAADVLGQGLPKTVTFDGFGRAVDETKRLHKPNGDVDVVDVRMTYSLVGEPLVISRIHTSAPTDPHVVRWMRYDSLGRLVLNVEPDSTTGFSSDPTTPPTSMKTWRYAYDLLGRLVGNSDARGCGENLFYDRAGRMLAEDFSPCQATHAPYSAINLANGVGAEVFNEYDTPDADDALLPATMPTASGPTLGRLTATLDRGAKTLVRYDARGRPIGMARKLVKPGLPSADPSLRYASHYYAQSVAYDDLDRPTTTSTGAVAPELLVGGASTITTHYTKRGFAQDVTSSYGPLVASLRRDADGRALQITFADAASTVTTLGYNGKLWLQSVTTNRTKMPGTAPVSPVATSTSGTLQLLLEAATIAYDPRGNPVSIGDAQNAAEWPAGAQPTSRAMHYDESSRLTRVDYTYPGTGGSDTWTSPFAAEDGGKPSTRHATPVPQSSFPNRLRYQAYSYDWLDNLVQSDDDAHGFYDRSIGNASLGTATAGPYQLQSATNAAFGGAYQGSLAAQYDAAGNMTDLVVNREARCLPSGSLCVQRYGYDWDETGQLARARRWDLAAPATLATPRPTLTPVADLAFSYDADRVRTLKSATDGSGNTSHTAYVFPTLELHRAAWLNADYEDTYATEAVYLVSGGAHVGRVTYDATTPRLASSTLNRHVFLELPDFLGSTATVIDRDTSEVVERATYEPYGATESDYRPDRWDAFREDSHRFTGKEDDIEVGLTYFGARYLQAHLGRWLSPDPLEIHELGADMNVYAYVNGRVFRATDPFGLLGSEGGGGSSSDGDGGGGGQGGGDPGNWWAQQWYKVKHGASWCWDKGTKGMAWVADHSVGYVVKGVDAIDDALKSSPKPVDVIRSAGITGLMRPPAGPLPNGIHGAGALNQLYNGLNQQTMEYGWNQTQYIVEHGIQAANIEAAVGTGALGSNLASGTTSVVNTARAVAPSAANAATKGAAAAASKVTQAGRFGWGAVRSRLGQELALGKGTPVHHWFIPQGGKGALTLGGFFGEQWGRFVPEIIKNRSWNLMVPPAGYRDAVMGNLWHMGLHGRGPAALPLLGRLWYGSPTWAKGAAIGIPIGAGTAAAVEDP